jgi:hypothetical protein
VVLTQIKINHEPDAFKACPALSYFMNTGTTDKTEESATETKPVEIFIVMEGGVVHEIVDLPDNINVTVIDYDTEGVEKERLEISPVDGELCVITRW